MFGNGGKRPSSTGNRPSSTKRKQQSPFQRNATTSSRPPPSRNNRGTTTTNMTTMKMSPAVVVEEKGGRGRDEKFELVHGELPLDFAMILRLTPDLVDEIKRVESQGGNARIKFDQFANNASGNVIDVGGKDFTFTWSHERGDLCDIYEERKSGEDGDGVLVETGGAWRKLNMQRILDESTKNHVKMRSEEAERKLKSRKAIVLDPGNPSLKNQVKASPAIATETNIRRMSFPPKNEPAIKKRKFEPTQVSVGGLPKSVYKPELSSKSTAKGRISLSPRPSPSEQFRASTSPFKFESYSKDMPNVEAIDVPHPQVRGEEKNTHLEKRNKSDSMDLQGMLINLLSDNPKGTSLKALEIAIGETFPNSIKKIGPALKKIAILKAPNLYILKAGAEFGGMKKFLPHESGRYADSSRDKTHISDPFEVNITSEILEHETQINSKLDESNFGVQDRLQRNSAEAKKASSSSDSDSDSDSDSKSESSTGSGSKSSSDSESNGSSKDNQSDVDIMGSGDEKEVTQVFEAITAWGSSLKQPGESKIDEIKPYSPKVFNCNQGTATVEMTDSAPSKANKRPGDEMVMPLSLYDNLQTANEQVSYGEIGKDFEKNLKSKSKSKSKVSSDALTARNMTQQQPSAVSNDDFVPDVQYAHKNPSSQRHRNHPENLDQDMLHSDTNPLPDKNSVNRDSGGEDDYDYSNLLPKYFGEESIVAKPISSDSHSRKQGENGAKIRNAREMEYFSGGSRLPAEKFSKGKTLRREPSDLELGELRDSIHKEDFQPVKKQFEKRNSFKLVGNTLTPFKNVDDSIKLGETGSHQFTMVDQVDSDMGFYSNNSADTSIKFRKNATRASQETYLIRDEEDSNRRQNTSRETKFDKSSKLSDMNNRKRESVLGENNNSLQNMKESFSDEDNFLYSKYEKTVPELRGPIKDKSQYKEYVEEYREKHTSYYSLNKNLQVYRDKFSKLGAEIDRAKEERDQGRYFSLREQLKEYYRQCITRHTRLKKIFIVLHKELECIKQRIKEYTQL